MSVMNAAMTGAAQQYLQGRGQKQKSEQDMKAEIFKMMIKKKIDAGMVKEQMEAYKDLVGSGKFKVQMGPSGFTFNPIDSSERLKNIEADEKLREAGYGGQNGQGQSNNLSQLLSGRGSQLNQRPTNVPQPMGGGAQPPMANRNAGGGGLLNLLRNQKIADKQAEASLKERTASRAGRKMGRVNVNIVGGAFKRLAQTYADATKEGTTGDIYRQTYAKNIVLGGYIPKGLGGGKMQEKFRRTAAYEGQKTEVIAKMMPMLTQQGDRPGSVRLIRSIFDRLSKTIPDLRHDTGPASEMIRESMKNMYGFAAAVQNAGGINQFAEQLGYNPNTLGGLNKQQISSLADNVYSGIQQGTLGVSVGLTPAQTQELNVVIEQVLAPINTLTQGSSYKVIRQVR